MKKIIIAGSRTIRDAELVKNTLSEMFTEPVTVVSGGAKGPDTMGEEWARDMGYPIEIHKADWSNIHAPGAVIRYNEHGSYNIKAGMDRNKKMLESVRENPDGGMLVAFWNGKSSGTKNMIDIANEAGMEVHIITAG